MSAIFCIENMLLLGIGGATERAGYATTIRSKRKRRQKKIVNVNLFRDIAKNGRELKIKGHWTK